MNTISFIIIYNICRSLQLFFVCNKNENGELKQLHHYLEDLAEPCDEMIIRCSFEGHVRKCSDLFKPQVYFKSFELILCTTP